MRHVTIGGFPGRSNARGSRTVRPRYTAWRPLGYAFAGAVLGIGQVRLGQVNPRTFGASCVSVVGPIPARAGLLESWPHRDLKYAAVDPRTRFCSCRSRLRDPKQFCDHQVRFSVIRGACPVWQAASARWLAMSSRHRAEFHCVSCRPGTGLGSVLISCTASAPDASWSASEAASSLLHGTCTSAVKSVHRTPQKSPSRREK